ncbi:F-box protein DOR [Raphanus sativus]|uniref:F-box protein DOR-like n=1 Tax=Raphanus sativus TaxID=3726 RepID=A0A6J0NEF7_RAPSA|nr:F-box protein DOR-like [Raphanus sativus]KAJ4903420.1 F-box protein DOR [Raphanus sativus]
MKTTQRRNERSKTLENGRDHSLPIPIDLVFEIFSRLPVKSIAICRCVSKTWSSILRRQDFTELFLSRSCALPKLLLACQKDGDLFFFSAPQPQNLDENPSPVVASCYMKLSLDAYFRNGAFEISGLDQGLMGLTHQWIGEKRKYSVPVICNPSTGQLLPLTRVKTRRVKSRNLFGYDPIDKQFKVLSVSEVGYGPTNMKYEEHQVITLQRGKLSQRLFNTDRVLHHLEYSKERCINGVLYYKTIEFSTNTHILVCFDVRSEKLNYIKVKKFLTKGTMVNYNGKLGLLLSGVYDSIIESSTSVNLWVLEDIEKQDWSEHTYVLPPSWKDIVGRKMLGFVGMTQTNEIVMRSERGPRSPFHLFYFNTKKNTVVRVEIQGIDEPEYTRVHIFLDHVENVTLM